MNLRSGRALDSCAKKRTTTGPEQPDHWSSIPREILCLIADKLVSIADYVRLVAVCRHWYSIAVDFNRLRFKPLYMSGADPDSRRVTLRDAVITVDLPETAGSRCWGLRSAGSLILTGPISGSASSTLVLIISKFHNLAFARPARPGRPSKVWSHIRGDLNLTDLTHCNGKLYGPEFSRDVDVQVVLFELNHRPNNRVAPRFVRFPTLGLVRDDSESWSTLARSDRHLVDLKGELCLCVSYYCQSCTTDFKLFKIDVSAGSLTQILSLGGHCLFLGNNYSFAYKTTHHWTNIFEHSCELVRNCVFYTYYSNWYIPWYGYNNIRPFDVEVWDMVRSTHVHCDSTSMNLKDSQIRLYGPLWILPAINFSKLAKRRYALICH